MGEVSRKLTILDVINEMYYILRDAHIDDGMRGFNSKTYTGKLEAKTEEEAIAFIDQIRTMRGAKSLIYDAELEVACMLDDIDEVNEDDLVRLQNMLAKLGTMIGDDG
jgi:hypothetical protein